MICQIFQKINLKSIRRFNFSLLTTIYNFISIQINKGMTILLSRSIDRHRRAKRVNKTDALENISTQSRNEVSPFLQAAPIHLHRERRNPTYATFARARGRLQERSSWRMFIFIPLYFLTHRRCYQTSVGGLNLIASRYFQNLCAEDFKNALEAEIAASVCFHYSLDEKNHRWRNCLQIRTGGSFGYAIRDLRVSYQACNQNVPTQENRDAQTRKVVGR